MNNISYLTPLFLCTLLWWVLTDGANAWVVGMPAIILATWLSVRLQTTHNKQVHRLNWAAIPAFALFFLTQSIKAGVDVARRTLKTPPDLAPGTLYYHTTLPTGSPRYVFGAVIGLFPGTLCTDFTENDELILHVLDTKVDVAADCRRLEQHITRLFNVFAQH